jgi:hypothetical protein
VVSFFALSIRKLEYVKIILGFTKIHVVVRRVIILLNTEDILISDLCCNMIGPQYQAGIWESFSPSSIKETDLYLILESLLLYIYIYIYIYMVFSTLWQFLELLPSLQLSVIPNHPWPSRLKGVLITFCCLNKITQG